MAFIGSQSILRLGNGASPEVFTTVFQVKNLPNFGQKNDLIPSTHLQSLAKEYVLDIPDGSEIQVTANFDPANATHAAILAAQAARTSVNMELVLPTGGGSKKFVFSALITGWDFSVEPSAIVDLVFGLKVNSAIAGPIPS